MEHRYYVSPENRRYGYKLLGGIALLGLAVAGAEVAVALDNSDAVVEASVIGGAVLVGASATAYRAWTNRLRRHN